MDGIAFSDVPREVVAEVGRAAADFSVGFATIRTGDRGDIAVLGGSGTLVRIDDMYGVLTAAHVLEYLPGDQDIGLIIPTGSEPPLVHQSTLAKGAVSRLRLGHRPYTREGPDIALLLISTLDARSLGARKSFYDLSSRCDEILRNPPGRTDGLWIVCGFVDEFTTGHGPDRGFSAVKGFHNDLSSVESFSMSPPRAMAEPSSPAALGGVFMPKLSSRHEAKPPNNPLERTRKQLHAAQLLR